MRAARIAFAAASLATVWVLLWGTPSAGNIISGLLVAGLLVIVLPGLRRPARPSRIRPRAIIRLAGLIVVNVIVSNAMIIRDIVTPGRRLRTGVVGVPLPECSDEVITLITSLLALTPGTIPLEVVDRPRAVYVHFLHVEDVETVRRAVAHLIELCVRSFGSDDDVASLEHLSMAATP